MKLNKFISAVVVVFVLSAILPAAEDWLAVARAALNRGDLTTAEAVVQSRLSDAPEDWEALGWHARIVARQGKWSQAESEYRKVLDHTPDDLDIVLGLADVLTWQNKHAEAFSVLGRSSTDHYYSVEILKRRARVLMLLGRTEEALAEYKSLLAIEPDNSEAIAAVKARPQSPRYELRFGNDTDNFNYTDAANTQLVSLRVRANSRVSASFGGEFYERFGQEAQKLRIGTTLNLSKNNYLNVSGAFATKQDVVSRYDNSVEFGRVFRFRSGFVRGLEATIEERSSWFTSSQVTAIRTGAILYLPNDWAWGISITAARSAFDDAGASWAPSGSTRLWFPLHNRVRGNLLWAVGTENYSTVDQIRRFAAQTYGGGVRISITEHQDISASTSYQRRTQGRTQTSAGVSYGIRF